jgi:hypothetical protein
MQIDRAAVIAAIEGLRPTGLTLTKGVGLYATITIEKVLAAINTLPANDARIDAGDAMKVVCLGYLYAHECSDEVLRAIQALDTATIVGYVA